MRRIPFTLALSLSILVTAAVTGTLVRDLSPGDLAAWGFDADDLADGRWFRLFLSTFRILDPYMAVTMLATVLAFVGACESRIGTARTAAVYALTHAAGTVALMAAAMALAAAKSAWGSATLAHPQVGASAGAFGALAVWLMFLPARARGAGVAAGAAFLVLAFLRDVHPWDVSHLVAFGGGLTLGAVLRRRDARGGRAGHDRFDTGDRRRAVAWLAAILGLVGFLTPFSIAQHVGLARVTAALGLDGVDAVRYVFFASGIALVAVARGLGRGERVSWRVALVASVVPVFGLWQKGLPGVEHVLAVLLVAALVAWRSEFAGPSPVPPWAAVWRAALAVPAAAVLYAAFGFLTLRPHFVPALPRAEVLPLAVLRLRFGAVAEPNWYSPRARWFLESLPWVVWGSLIAAVAIVAWRAFKGRGVPTPQSPGGRAPRSEVH